MSFYGMMRRFNLSSEAFEVLKAQLEEERERFDFTELTRQLHQAAELNKINEARVKLGMLMEANIIWEMLLEAERMAE